MTIFSGYLIYIDDIVNWLRWFHYLSQFYHALIALSISEFHDITFDCDDGNTIDGDTYLSERFAFDEDDDFLFHQILACVMLCILAALLRVVGIVTLVHRSGV